MHKEGPLPTLQVLRFLSNLGDRLRSTSAQMSSLLLAGIQIYITLNEAMLVAVMVASYSRKLDCICAQHSVLSVPITSSS